MKTGPISSLLSPLKRPKLELSYERRKPFRIRRLELIFEELPEALRNYRMVQLTDFHFGPLTSALHLRHAVAVVNDLGPDIALLTGDFVQFSATGVRHMLAQRVHPELFGWTRYRREVRRLTLQLREILDPLDPPDGILGVFGNHDYNEGIGTIRRTLQDRVHWLKNTGKFVRKPGGSIFFAGVDDFKYGKPSISAALQQAESSQKSLPSAIRILLSHNPDIVLLEEKSLIPSFHLVLCGHTHGGQVRLPWLPPLITRTKQRDITHDMNFFRETPLYISNGIGYGGLPIRLFCPPEITLIILRAK